MRIILISILVAASSPAAMFGQGVTQTALRVGSPVASQFEDGPPLGSLRLVPGEIVHFAFTVENYRRSDAGRVELTGHVEIFDPRGISISPSEEIPLITNLSDEDKNWKARLRSEIALPTIAPPGTYKVKFGATDEQSHQSSSGEASFQVDAKYVAPANELTIRELHFFRNQEDQTALITPSYRAGDTVWVKFYMTGYKFGGQNAIDTSYDVDVEGPDGKAIMHQEDAAMQKSLSYYPQPYIPAIFNLTLKPTTSHSVFKVVISAHDAMGKQTAIEKAEFQVN